MLCLEARHERGGERAISYIQVQPKLSSSLKKRCQRCQGLPVHMCIVISIAIILHCRFRAFSECAHSKSDFMIIEQRKNCRRMLARVSSYIWLLRSFAPMSELQASTSALPNLCRYYIDSFQFEDCARPQRRISSQNRKPHACELRSTDYSDAAQSPCRDAVTCS